MRYWYRRILIMIFVFTVAVGGSYTLIELRTNQMKKEVNSDQIAKKMLLPGGMPVGIYLKTSGVMILGTQELKDVHGEMSEPAADVVKSGDYITQIDGKRIERKSELIEAVRHLNAGNAKLTIQREEKELHVEIKPVQCEEDEYKLGIWVRDNAQGLGTITYLDANSSFGALGHGIHDVDTGEILEIDSGTLYLTSIKEIQKGVNGVPGGMEGVIVYNNYNVIGKINSNTDAGIFGTIDRVDTLFADQTPMEAASKGEIQEGPATIRCSLDGTVREYDIKILRVNLWTGEINKGLTVEVTDPELLEQTGGIVQGMSGSPIIQNGKIVGAVTHVFVNNPRKGYGIFIENMLEH